MHGSFFLNQYIRRDLVINEILDSLNSDNPQENAFKLTGIRGAGKTVTLTAIDRQTMNLDEKTATEMAEMTKGYAYAYQTFGY